MNIALIGGAIVILIPILAYIIHGLIKKKK